MSKIKETSTNFENKIFLNECDQIFAASLIAGQWTLVICCHLTTGKLRFGELKKRIPTITERMLTLQLRKMEEGDLVKRTVYAEVPPRVEYELTKSGQELSPILKQLGEWGKNHRKTRNAEKSCTTHKVLAQ
ncbi:winged helix-turn-helix transcriptional regulator [Arcticibacter eurypsychrophilus]|uniref:winged helix-turn-helix transcriptional regulator n=1 Tax=Arcticibacter eurypsychrophilus TaxID=1434752 RepID=UPI00084CF738|nr:winged helix-turn-helix transcriptional regulator [Arcticibacter eurypsychrophilus]